MAGGVIGIIWMVFGYFIGGGILKSSFAVAATSIPENLVQGAAGMAIFLVVGTAFYKLENLGFLDPTSAAKNYEVKEKCEENLRHWAKKRQHILIAGHTHRPVLPQEPSFYYNTGSCVHPRCITCIEIERGEMTLVKWTMNARIDSSLYVAREIISGPVRLL